MCNSYIYISSASAFVKDISTSLLYQPYQYDRQRAKYQSYLLQSAKDLSSLTTSYGDGHYKFTSRPHIIITVLFDVEII